MSLKSENVNEIIKNIKKNEQIEEHHNKAVTDMLIQTSRLREESARLSDLVLEKEMEREKLQIAVASKREEVRFEQMEQRLIDEARIKMRKANEESEILLEKTVEEEWNKRRDQIKSIREKIKNIKSQVPNNEEINHFKELLLGTLGQPKPEVENNEIESEIEEEFIDFEQLESLNELESQNLLLSYQDEMITGNSWSQNSQHYGNNSAYPPRCAANSVQAQVSTREEKHPPRLPPPSQRPPQSSNLPSKQLNYNPQSSPQFAPKSSFDSARSMLKTPYQRNQSASFQPKPSNNQTKFSTNQNSTSNYSTNQSSFDCQSFNESFSTNQISKPNYSTNRNPVPSYTDNENSKPNSSINQGSMNSYPVTRNSAQNISSNQNPAFCSSTNRSSMSNMSASRSPASSNQKSETNFSTNQSSRNNYSSNNSSASNYNSANSSSTFKAPANRNPASTFSTNQSSEDNFSANSSSMFKVPANRNPASNYSTNQGSQGNFSANQNSASNYNLANSSSTFMANKNPVSTYSTNQSSQSNFSTNQSSTFKVPANRNPASSSAANNNASSNYPASKSFTFKQPSMATTSTGGGTTTTNFKPNKYPSPARNNSETRGNFRPPSNHPDRFVKPEENVTESPSMYDPYYEDTPSIGQNMMQKSAPQRNLGNIPSSKSTFHVKYNQNMEDTSEQDFESSEENYNLDSGQNVIQNSSNSKTHCSFVPKQPLNHRNLNKQQRKSNYEE